MASETAPRLPSGPLAQHLPKVILLNIDERRPMSEEQDDAEDSPRHYVPSGRVNVASLVPILVASVWVALGMAFVLLFAERRLYLPFLTPMLLGLPVFGVIGLSVRWGQCRNRGLGGLIGVILVFVYYAGYWELSYLTNVVARGPRMVAACARIGRLPGLPGYVVYRCKSTRPLDFRRGRPNGRPPSLWGTLFGAILIGGETFVITAMGARVGRSASSCPFSERSRRWTSRFEFRLPLATREAVEDAIARGDWAALADLPRASSIVNAQTNSLLLLLDYVPDVPDEPAYLTLIAGQGGTIETLARQRLVPATDFEAIAVEFPELKIGRGEGSKPASTLSDPAGLAEDPQVPAQPDFRDRAVAASRSLVARLHPRNFRTVPASFCLLGSAGGVRELSRAGRRAALLQAVISFGMFASLLGAFLAVQLANPRRGPLTAVTLVGGVSFLFFGLANLINSTVGDRLRKPFLIQRLGHRYDSLIHEGSGLPSMLVRIEDARTYHRTKLSPEDIGIAFLDVENRRLLVEGVSHRYVIRGEDVTCLWPLQAHSIISARIDYEIGGERLSLVLARRNPWFILWGPSANRTFEQFLASLSHTLGCEPGTWEGAEADHLAMDSRA